MARPRGRPGSGPDGSCRARTPGFSILELLLVIGVVGTMSGVAVPGAVRALQRYRAVSAVRLVSGTLQRARALAVSRGDNVAIRFTTTAAGIRFAAYADGNRNGVSSGEIADGTDPQVESAQGLDAFAGVEFGLWPGIVSPDGAPFVDLDPIRVGAARLVSFAPGGTATPGSIYIKGSRGLQFAVRIYGDTGKTHMLEYLPAQRRWSGL